VNSAEFSARTKAYTLRIIRLVDALPKDEVARTLGHQLLRSGCSVSATYRAANRGKSRADTNRPYLLRCCHREVREARRGDPAGLLRRFAPRNDSVFSSGDWYDIIAQLAIVEEEGDETLHWFDLLVDSVRVKPDQVALLKQEGGEILSMILASIRTAKARS
jgi:hypothetical protein